MFRHNHRQLGPSVKYIPPTVISQYVNQWITTSIPGYGRVTAYVLDYNPTTGMVSMFIFTPPAYHQQFIQVHHSDLVGIAPYFGPTPPGTGHGQGYGPRPRPPHQGGGFFPWLFGQMFRN